MRKIIMISLLFIAGLKSETFAQLNQEVPVAGATPPAGDSLLFYSRPNVLKTNLLGIYSLFYEAQVSAKHSLQLSVNYANIAFLWDEARYFSLTAAFKFYLSKKAGTARRPYPSGFYVSPYLRYVNVHDIGNSFSGRELSEVAHNLFGGGAVAGYQLIFRKGLTLDFFGGGGYLPLRSSKVLYTYTSAYDFDSSAENYKVEARLGLCIGYAFKNNPQR